MCFGRRHSYLCVISLLLCSTFPASGGPITDDHDHAHHNHTPNSTKIDIEQVTESNVDANVTVKGAKSDKYASVTIEYFLDELMKKYGNGDTMSFEGFEHLLEKLNLANIVFLDHHLDCHKTNNSSEFLSLHSDHNHSSDGSGSSKIPCPNKSGAHITKDSHGHNHDDHDHGADDHSGHNHDHLENQKEESHTDHDHDHEGHDHEGHDHGDEGHNHDDHDHDHDHEGHDHEGHDHEGHDHEGHDHGDEGHDHDHDHEGHDQKGHSHDDHEGHDHGDEGHDHDHDHEGHDQKGHSHDDHEGHDHGDEGHDHDHDHEGHDHEGHDHGEEGHSHDDHDHDNHDHEGHDHAHDDHHDHDHDHSDEKAKRAVGEDGRARRSYSAFEECMPPKMMLNLVDGQHTHQLTRSMFMQLCPALIYQIDSDSCHSHPHTHDKLHDHDHDGHGHDHDHDHDHPTASQVTGEGVTGKVWGFSIIAVIIISAVGLLGVAVIPIVQKVFYNHLLQFLVALAVGALSGDALLHLLPHAIGGGHAGEGGSHAGHDHGSHSHDLDPIYKGLCGLLGIYFFFLTERILTIFTDMKRRKKKRKNKNRYTTEEEDSDKVGERLANSDMECDEMMMSIHPNKALKGFAEETHTENCAITLPNTAISHQHGQRHNHGDEETMMVSLTSNGHGGHHGHHGHSHCKDGVPKSVSAIAWMVILGDGVHNFSDGLAIGAAFANSITGGFSTSIAVFCHELPHEIGDFAMLLRAGMSPKQAVIYNCVSSILCFLGMLIGVAIGNIQNASLWIFAVVAGMFLYIALVDMLPEMSSVDTKEGENPFFHLFLQLLGMLIGAGIMLVIALYEEDLRTIFE